MLFALYLAENCIHRILQRKLLLEIYERKKFTVHNLFIFRFMFHGNVGHRNQLSESDEPELKNELIQSKFFFCVF
jgi:hypothetical protein